MHLVGMAVLLFVLWGVFFSNAWNRIAPCVQKEPRFRTHGKVIQIKEDGDWKPFEIKGINMGTGYPGLFPNETGIEEETYARWFEQIAEMNANVVRVYKIQSPEFYTAFLKYNQNHAKKLYLIQGIDFSDDLMFSEENVFRPDVKEQLFAETNRVIDAVHGQELMLNVEEQKLFCYTSDVSDYLLGYMLGVEWDEMFVEYTCQVNKSVDNYDGTFLRCGQEANPFECFMAEWADQLLVYENALWGGQPMISYCNWPNTDALINEFEIQEILYEEQMVDVEAVFDVDRIQMTDVFKSGVFASYNVYPYFPYFLQCGPYAAYVDDEGRMNPYRKYLMELVDHHAYPVVVSEYGISASRCRAYGDVWRGLDHGGVNEQMQAHGLMEMYRDIQKAQCAGSIAFTWQDEWYKTTWNEKQLSDPDGRAFWSNAQCAEQSFGVLAFEPGDGTKLHYPDGSISEWEDVTPLMKKENLTLKMHSDERYVHFCVEGLGENAMARPLQIALDVTPKSGKETHNGRSYGRPIDFVVSINPQNGSALYVHRYYDALPFSAIASYHEMSVGMMAKINAEVDRMEGADLDALTVVKRADGDINSTLNNHWALNATGMLRLGDANPEHAAYDSNADYCFAPNAVEIRIPWQLLNFYDPSNCKILEDFHKNGYKVEGLEIDALYAAAYYSDDMKIDKFGEYELERWDEPTFHERRKQSYEMLKKIFGGEMGYDH